MFPHSELDLQSRGTFNTRGPQKVMILPKKENVSGQHFMVLTFKQPVVQFCFLRQIYRNDAPLKQSVILKSYWGNYLF